MQESPDFFSQKSSLEPVAELMPSSAKGPNTTPALSVSELTTRIKNQLEMSYPSVTVQGELSNFKRQSSGHLYFSLKDESAQIQVALFASSAQKIAFQPRDGDQVIIRGSVSVYSQRGQYQILAKSLEKVGLGEILLKLEALKRELKSLGWLDPAGKKPLPLMPRCIGVVTSPTGAVIRDILHVLQKRHPGFHLILYPARVQGAGAAQEVAEGIRTLNRSGRCEVIIVARGGGSFEDLMAFNERELLQAVHESELPIISAVGHETDFTLCDFVADMRAPTPSAAAERVLPAKGQLQEQVNYFHTHIQRILRHQLEQAQTKITAFKKSKFLAEPQSLIHSVSQRIDDLESYLLSHLQHLIEQKRFKIDRLSHLASPLTLQSVVQRSKLKLEGRWSELKNSLQQLSQKKSHLLTSTHHRLLQNIQRLHQHQAVRFAHVRSSFSIHTLLKQRDRCEIQLKGLRETLEALSPESAMRRGYAILRTEKLKPIQSTHGLACGDLIEVQLQDGKLWSLVQRIEHKKSKSPSPPKSS